MREVTGQTLRPGGFSLTEKAVQFCGISKGDTVLDLGCGMGATIGYLYENHGIKGVGIDPSKKLLDMGRKQFKSLDFILGTGDYLPFEEKSFNCVLAECTLSLMDDINKTINQVLKVLKDSGTFIITDVYAKNSNGIKALEDFSFNSCMRGLHDIDCLKEKLVARGFEIMLFEDCSDLLKALMVKIIFSYGSMNVFWRKTTENSDCVNGCQFQEILKACKPGYFILIAKKGNESNG
ncbi:methyltransferase type 11 [Acetobacterium bakii]|uniref:Methyltransferase type 11 n=2 Tax=Acetobacterium bakii TaxID=52689 RepID=A0A0L6U6P0_9FIRM|nr:methyltransferase type 11 [Acetobacterium bakii]